VTLSRHHCAVTSTPRVEPGGRRLTNNIPLLRFHAGQMTQAERGEKIGVIRQTAAAIEQVEYSPTWTPSSASRTFASSALTRCSAGLKT